MAKRRCLHKDLKGPTLKKGPGVKNLWTGTLVCLGFYVSAFFQDFHWIWIDCVYHKDRLLVIIAEEKSKGKCVLSGNSRQFN